jgi:hypothetical protein
MPQVINGASDLMVEVFGDAGRHARSAVGSVSLPLNVATEVEAVIELEDSVRCITRRALRRTVLAMGRGYQEM